jgi:uncharacterized membrane protein
METLVLGFFSRLWRTGVAGTFLAGLLFLLPVALTIYIAASIVAFMRDQLGPGTVLGGLMTRTGIGIIGQEQDTLAFLLGLLIAGTGIWFLGLIVRIQTQSLLQEGIDNLFARVPLIRLIYKPVARVIRLMTARSGGELASMSAVCCRFGGENGTDILALASPDIYMIAGERRRLVYLPTSPVSMSGGLVMVPESSIIPMPGMRIDDVMKLYLSFGIMAPETFSRHKAVAPAPVPLPPAAGQTEAGPEHGV